MAKKKYHVVPNDGNWSVKRGGAKRSSSVHTTQKSAVDAARELAKSKKTEVVIHRRDGRIRDSDSYGNDPHPPKDRKH